MSQTWTDNPFAPTNVGQTDLQSIENNLLALKSMFSGGSAPSNPTAGMPWFDTTQKVLKYRNQADSAWYGVMHGDTSEKRIVYRDSALEGYARDSGVTDKVIALKGGSTYTTGAASAGSWTISGLSNGSENSHRHNHGHKWYNWTAVDAHDQSYNGSGSLVDIPTASKSVSGYRYLQYATGTTGVPDDMWTQWDNSTGTAHTHSASQDGSWRILAAVCILVYLDL